MKQLPDGEGERLPARSQYIELPQPEAINEPDGPGLIDYWRILKRRKGTVFLFALGGVAAAALFSLPQTPVYQAKITLEVLNINDNLLNRRQLEPAGTTADYTPELNIQTEVKLLQSESLVQRVANKLTAPEPRKLAGGATRISAWRKALGLAQSKPQPGEETQTALARSSLTVKPVERTRLVEARYDSPDPVLAAEFLNVLAREFIEQSIEGRWDTSRKTGDWLGRQIQELKIKLENAEDELQRYAATTGLLFTGESDNVAEEKLKQLQAELSRAQAERTAKQSQYELARTASAASLPQIMDDKQLGDYQAKLTDLRRQAAELSTNLTPSHYRVRQVEAQIQALEEAFERQRANVLARIRNEYEAAQRRENLLARDFTAQSKLVSDQAARAVHYNILKREVETHRQVYEAMLQRVKEYGIASAMQASNIRVVDPAKPPRLPYKPNYPVNSALGLMAGMFLGAMFVVIREGADRTIQSPGDAAFYLEVPELGVIPSARVRKLAGYHHRTREDTAIELVTARRTASVLGESFRATLTSILFSGNNGNQPKVLVLTSANEKEGKSTLVSNLGLALAEIHRRVLLIDGDLRKPRLHEIFETPNDYGLSDLLQCAPTPEGHGLIVETAHDGLCLLPAGRHKGSAANLLHSARMPELLRRFRKEFDAVLIDTPPMLSMPDARILGRLADGVILVVRSKMTTRDMAQAAVARFAEDGTVVLGTVLNDWDPKRSSGGYYGYYKGYGRGYYSSAYYRKEQ